MAHFLRGKQAGVPKDFSAGLDPQNLVIDQVCKATPSDPYQRLRLHDMESTPKSQQVPMIQFNLCLRSVQVIRNGEVDKSMYMVKNESR